MLDQPVRALFSGLLDLIYPKICFLCRTPLTPSESAGLLCPLCLQKITPNHPVFCAKCSRPLSSMSETVCRQCQRHSPAFDRCWSAVIYDDTMRYLLHLFKYGGNTGLRLPFAALMIHFIKKYRVPIHDCDLIVPVPLHAARFRERGFNQSELIAALLARHFQIPCDLSLINRRRHTVNQARVNSKQRWTNMQGTFRIKQSHNIINTNIMIIDDLLTTGATLSEIAGGLKQAGANKVYGLTTAIAV